MARWRDGCCPVHGGGLVDDDAGDGLVRCSVEECTVRAKRFAAGDAYHASFGWREGPEEIRALLAKAGDIAAQGDEPGPRARRVRTSYSLEPR